MAMVVISLLGIDTYLRDTVLQAVAYSSGVRLYTVTSDP
jgi:hypothetical protein